MDMQNLIKIEGAVWTTDRPGVTAGVSLARPPAVDEQGDGAQIQPLAIFDLCTGMALTRKAE